MSRVASDLDRMPEKQARVLLVQMPFGSVKWPALGISVLKATVVRNGLACDIRYLNLPFATLNPDTEQPPDLARSLPRVRDDVPAYLDGCLSVVPWADSNSIDSRPL